MLVMGLIGLVLERHRVPMGPVVLGIILGGPLEERFLQTLTGSQGDLTAFFARPMAAVLGIVCIVVWLTPLVMSVVRRGSTSTTSA
jgi:TctA family transporter